MATQQFTSTELSNAQRVYITEVYKSYQNEAPVWGWIDQLPADKVNKKGLQVPIEVSANPSLGFATGDGDDMPTAQAPNFHYFTVTYTGLQAGTNETYAALLNNNKETSEDMFRYITESDARQFASFLDAYVSAGDGTQGLATVSTNYAGGTPTLAVCNGTSDSIGDSNLIVGGYYTFWDSAGTTQRTGTVGAGAVQLASKSASTATFGANIPSDVVATDIIVPASTTTNASSGLYGLPIIIDSSTTYFGESRTTYNGLASYEKTSAGTVTAGMLAETYASIQQRGGYFGKDQLIDMLWLCMNTGNWNMYLGLTYSSGAIVGGVHQLNHVGSQRPNIDVGGSMVNFTWFGAPIKLGAKIRGDEIYFLNPKEIRRAILKDVGPIASGMPASDYLQSVDGDGNYQNARLKWRDFWGQVYAPRPYRLGKISGITLTSPTQKATAVLSN